MRYFTGFYADSRTTRVSYLHLLSGPMFAPYNSVSMMHYVMEYHLLSVTEVSVVDYSLPKKDFAKAVDLQMFSTNNLDTVSC